MFGTHIKKAHHADYESALQDEIDKINKVDKKYKIAACQVFILGPQNFNFNFTEKEAENFGKYTAARNIKIIVHNSYIVSLWTPTLSRRPYFIKMAREQLELCDKMNATGFVIHLPNEEPQEIIATLYKIYNITDKDDKENKNKKINQIKTRIYLETKSSKPALNSYEKPERLKILFDAFRTAELEDIGYCVDTAHLWSSGVSLTTAEEAAQWLGELKKSARHIMFHLNDAQNDKGSGHDVHATLARGQIWRDDQSGLKKIIEFIKENNLISIFERNKNEDLNADFKFICE
jgi:endonuclease IV